jgi:hypothetical protein
MAPPHNDNHFRFLWRGAMPCETLFNILCCRSACLRMAVQWTLGRLLGDWLGGLGGGVGFGGYFA